MENIKGKGEVVYNQAALQQERIHEIYSRIDENSINLFDFNFKKALMDIYVRNYEIIITDLNSLFLTICSKLDQQEKDNIEQLRIELRNLVRTNPPYIFKTDISRKKRITSKIANQDLIADTIQKYRMLIEIAMEKHGFSNPSKADVTKSVVDM